MGSFSVQININLTKVQDKNTTDEHTKVSTGETEMYTDTDFQHANDVDENGSESIPDEADEVSTLSEAKKSPSTTQTTEKGSEESTSSDYRQQGQDQSEENDSRDDKICVIHVGPHKTGSTTLEQFLLVDHKDDLAKDNYATTINQHSGKSHMMLAYCTRPYNSKHCPNNHVRETTLKGFQSFVDDAAAQGSNIILSSEEFDMPQVNITQLTSVLLPHQYKIHVVVYYRRLYDWIHSIHNQQSKKIEKGVHTTFVQWLTDDVDAVERMSRSYSLDVYNRYMGTTGVSNVTVVNMHEDPQNFNTYERFVCDHMDHAPRLCEIAKSTPVRHSNPSQSLDWTLFRNSIPLYHSVELNDLKEKWIQIEAKFDEMTNPPKICLSPERQEKLLQLSIEAEKALTPEAWHNSEEGLENLRSDFEEKIKTKFCSLDIEKILKSTEWQDFLTDLAEDNEEEGS